jgi:hypothetical protein
LDEQFTGLHKVKAQDLMQFQLNFSRQEGRQRYTGCTKFVWQYGKLESGHEIGQIRFLSPFRKKEISNSVITTEQ